MERLNLAPDLSLSRIIQGFWRLEDWHLNPEELAMFIEDRVALGVTSFDIAEIYADTRAETRLGEALKLIPDLREDIEIVTKTGIFRGEHITYYDTTFERIIRSCEASLERLNTGYIDLYLIHREDPLIDHAEAAAALQYLKKRGLIREFGVSNFDPFKFNALHEATGKQLRTNQIEWHPMCYEHFKSGMMDYLQQVGVHPMIWSPLAGGRLFDDEDATALKVHKLLNDLAHKYETKVSTIVYAWILQHPVKAMPIVGSSRLERLEEAIAGLDIVLEREDWYRIYLASGENILR